MDLGLALPKAAVFMSGPEMRRAFRRVPPALRLRSGREIFKSGKEVLWGDRKLNKIKILFNLGRNKPLRGPFQAPGTTYPPGSRSGGCAEYLPAS